MGWNSASQHRVSQEQIDHVKSVLTQIEGLSNRIAEVSNDISGFSSLISKAGASVGCSLRPLLLEARQHEQAAHGIIDQAENIVSQCYMDITAVNEQLGLARRNRSSMFSSSFLLGEASRLYQGVVEVSRQVDTVAVIEGKAAGPALAHAEYLSTQIRQGLDAQQPSSSTKD